MPRMLPYAEVHPIPFLAMSACDGGAQAGGDGRRSPLDERPAPDDAPAVDQEFEEYFFE